MIIALVFVLFGCISCYKRLCVNTSIGLTGEKVYAFSDSTQASAATYKEYCYVNLGAVGGGSYYDAQQKCIEWHPTASLVSFNEEGEYTWVHSNMKYGGTTFWSGWLKTDWVNSCESMNQADVRWTDRSSTSYFFDKPVSYGSGCTVEDNWCFNMDNSGNTNGLLCAASTATTKSYHVICRYRIPFCDKPSYSVDACSKHGSCYIQNFPQYQEHEYGVPQGVCECDFLFTGDSCEGTYSCGDKRWDEDGVCGDRGNCTAQDNCVCIPGYIGSNCEILQVNGTLNDTQGANSSEGTYTFKADCTEDKEVARNGICYKDFDAGKTYAEAEAECISWGGHLVSLGSYSEEMFIREKYGNVKIGLNRIWESGDINKIKPCPPTSPDHYQWRDFEASVDYVVQRGTAVKCDSYTKFCFEIRRDFYLDEIHCLNTSKPFVCSRPLGVCAGKTGTDPLQCNQRGKCLYTGVCACFNNYVGDNCQTWKCGDVLWNSKSKWNPPCNGHGDCIAPNTCKCSGSDYGGTTCEFSYCNGIIGTSPYVCSGHGTCSSYDTCICDEGWGEIWCGVKTPTNDGLEPYRIHDWTQLGSIAVVYPGYELEAKKYWDNVQKKMVSCGSPYSCATAYPAKILYHVYRYPTRLQNYPPWGTYDEADTIKLLTFDEAEAYANEVWMKGKGHLYSAHNMDEKKFMQAQRHNEIYGMPDGNENEQMFDMWIGLKKKFDFGVTSYSICNIPEFQGTRWTDGSDHSWADTPWVNKDPFYGAKTCLDGPNTNAACFSVRTASKGYNPQEMGCCAPRPALFYYDLHYCNGTLEGTPTVCNGNGYCWDHDNCTCKTIAKGASAYSDEWCKSSKCHDIPSTDIKVCSGNGDCTTEGKCECADKWFGPYCNITICFGRMTNETVEGGGGITKVSCSGHGTCDYPDECVCSNANYFGTYCNLTYCNYIPSDDYANVCNGHGVCKVLDSCECTPGSGYYGKYCDVMKCFGITGDESTVCSGRGSCLKTDVCTCQVNEYEQYFGKFCNVTMCYGRYSNDTEVCSGKGKCWPFGTCDCTDGSSFNCDRYLCFEETDPEKECNGKGKCVGVNKCDCTTDGYYGKECKITTCDGIYSNDTSVCWARGICTEKDKCVCKTGYSHGVLNKCDNYSCNGIPYNDKPMVCSGRGTCLDLDNCTCTEKYDPVTYCQYPLCYGIASNLKKTVCSGNGDCIAIDNCKCNTHYYGRECDEFIDPSKKISHFYDYIARKRKLSIPYSCDFEAFESGVQQSSRRSSFKGQFSCSSIFKRYFVSKKLNHGFFGEGPLCEVVGYPKINGIEFTFGTGTKELLKKGIEYTLEFEFRTLPGVRVNFTYVPTKDEKNNENAPQPNIDNNDEPDENKDKDENNPPVSDGADGLSGGEIAGIAVGGTSFLSIIFVSISICCCCCCLTLFSLLGCVCLTCCCCTSSTCCCYCLVNNCNKAGAAKDKETHAFDMQFKFST